MPSRGKKKKNEKIIPDRKNRLSILNQRKIIEHDKIACSILIVATMTGYIIKNIPDLCLYNTTLFLLANLLIIAAMISILLTTLPPIKEYNNIHRICDDNLEHNTIEYKQITNTLMKIIYSNSTMSQYAVRFFVCILIIIAVVVPAIMNEYKVISPDLYIQIVNAITDLISCASLITVFVNIHKSYGSIKTLDAYIGDDNES